MNPIIEGVMVYVVDQESMRVPIQEPKRKT